MAVTNIPAPIGAAKLSPAQLSEARAAFVERVDAACDRAMRAADMVGMPFRLIEASCYLAAHGVAAPACRGETFFGWDISTSRRFLDGLNATARDAEIEAGRKVLFEGTRCRPAIVRGVIDLARDLAVASDEFTAALARRDSQRAADAARRDAEKAVAHG